MNTGPKFLRLKPTHSTAKKFDKLCALADKLGINIEVYSGRMSLTDRDKEDIIFFIDDVEDNDQSFSQSFSSFPPATEYKITYEDPIHKAALKKAAKEEAEQAERERIEKARLKEEARREQEAIEKERYERTLLIQLKAKYK